MHKTFKEVIQKLGKKINDKIKTPILVGGWAVNQLGFARNTIDFDIMIFEDEFEIVRNILNNIGFSIVVKTPLYARFESQDVENIIDVLFTNRKTYDLLAKEGRQCEIAGLKLIIPKLEHLIAMKLHALKYGQDYRGTKDLIDIIELIKANNIDIDSEIFQQLCLKYGTEDIYRRIADEFKK